MIAFVVSVNGQRVSTIGVGESGGLHAILMWSGQKGEPEYLNELNLSVGGFDSRTNEHISWPDPPEINVGDIITVQVIETDSVDQPTSRKTAAQLRKEGEQFVTEMEREHQARRRQKLDEELPPLPAPWEINLNQNEDGATDE